ncbi:hypothetical protein FNH05_12010 [Amycolatopsis rhizosphaerae]|uniref:Methylamine utilisation protein MauE domain-containing protein n=1 Tax=Amycolatopsis rhizosphaerae TaxID=2053003 RepID=A0A558CWY2_9PSEU|nr:MauE/DoxX family redox-associated membrane protein [Amycolatopsis rhizosphaerae]TVT53281.1 hypothetical protein FNH05_12010 [Amycolatopsis rhizosphaerae]
MTILLASAPLALAAVLAFAALGKLTNVTAFAKSVAGYDIVPARAALPVACLVLGTELVSAVLLVLPGTRFWGAGLAFVLFAAFLAGMASTLARGMRVDCGCFAGVRDTIGPGTLVRTGLLLALTVPAALATRAAFRPVHLAVAAVILAVLFGLSTLVRRRTTRPVGPRTGTIIDLPAPIGELGAGSEFLLFAFVSPDCGLCRRMLPEFRSAAKGFRLVLVSAASEAELREHVAVQDDDLPVVTGPRVFETNNIPWPPYAAITSGTGTVLAHGGAASPEQLHAMLAEVR